MQYPFYLPATRYVRSGFSITVDYEYSTDGWPRARPTIGCADARLRRAAARQLHRDRAHATTRSTRTPRRRSRRQPARGAAASYGIYSVPRASRRVHAGLRDRCAAPPISIPPRCARRVSGNMMRVDFDYYADAPATGAAPAGTATYGSVRSTASRPAPTSRGMGHARNRRRPRSATSRKRSPWRRTTPVVEYYAPSTRPLLHDGRPERRVALLDLGTGELEAHRPELQGMASRAGRAPRRVAGVPLLRGRARTRTSIRRTRRSASA